MIDYTELSLPQRQREEIHRILSNAADRAGPCRQRIYIAQPTRTHQQRRRHPSMLCGARHPLVESLYRPHRTLKPL